MTIVIIYYTFRN